MMMLTSLVLLLVIVQLVSGQCPNIAASFGDDLNLSSFSLSLHAYDASEGVGEYSDLYLVNAGIVVPNLFITVNNLSMELTATLDNNINMSQVYMIISTEDDQSACMNNSDVDQPLIDEKSIELQIECSAVSTRTVTLCIHLTDRPFKEGNGAYHVITVPLNINCTDVTVVESQCEMSSSNEPPLGHFCLTPSQIDTIFNSGQGQWGSLLSAAVAMRFCLIFRGEVVFLLHSISTLKQYPIYRNLSMIQFDVENANPNSPYPLLFFVNITSTNNSVTVAKSNTTTGIAKANEPFTFEVALPCFLEEDALVNVTLRWSQFQLDGRLIQRSHFVQFYRSCIPTINDNTTKKNDDNLMVVVVVPTVVVVFLLLLIVIIILCILYHYKKNPIKEKINDISTNPSYVYLELPLKSLEQYCMEYDYGGLHLEGKIGEGEFGVVYKARAPGLKRGDWEISTDEFVAVKMLKSDANVKAMLNFQKEVDTAVNFEHNNVIRLLGICTKQIDQTCMIFEYMELGALRELLQKSNPRNPDFYQLSSDEVTVKPSQFLSICIQLAKGLDYLSKKRFVHRDIATRNCLVDSQFVCKIADFGLSRDVYGSDYYKVGSKSACLPVRWMPPESLLYGRFTIKSDVWSYGVLMWEVFTFATQPYFGASNQEVIDNIRGLVLLECPLLCTQEIYDIMLECWQKMPVKRPHIGEILESLERLQQNNVTIVKDIENYINLQPLVVVNTELLMQSIPAR